MTNPILDAKQECREIVLTALGRCVAEGELPAEPIPDFTVEIPGDISHGDFATNIAMVSARVFRKAPRQIAEALTAQMVLLGTSFDAVEVAGAGFINFTLGRRWFSASVQQALNAKENYGRTDYGQGKRMLVEFVSANPTGPMHIGNARGGALGDGIAAVLDWSGYESDREFCRHPR